MSQSRGGGGGGAGEIKKEKKKKTKKEKISLKSRFSFCPHCAWKGGTGWAGGAHPRSPCTESIPGTGSPIASGQARGGVTSPAAVAYGLTPKLLCSLVKSLISEVGGKGRCSAPPHIPELMGLGAATPVSVLGWWGAAPAAAVGSLPPCRQPWGHSPNPLSASSGKREK